MSLGAPIRSAFQEAAVDRIVSRLRDKNGSRRFLLADEVGLGKTIVARGVIDRLLERRSHPLVVIYLCSNAEIAEQNRKKLDPEAGAPVGRLTSLALKENLSDSRLQLYSFTPGTSMSDGTGLQWERRLILFLLQRALHKDITGPAWREFFRCSVGEKRWDALTSQDALENEFSNKTSVPFQRALADEWQKPVWLHEQERVVLSRVIREEVHRFAAEPGSDAVRRRRGRVIALLRKGLQAVALQHLDPDLVILDEVQRFKEVLEEEDDPESIAGRLFAKKSVAVLILSATPYKMLTLDHENESHYDDLLQTLSFLRRGAPDPDPIQVNLKRFRERLMEGHFLSGPDLELRDLKRVLEAELKQIMCRTERNRYLMDVQKGVEEILNEAGAQVPDIAELTEFVLLRRFLLSRVQTQQHITEFWKSSPSVLTFMDGHYALINTLRRQGIPVPRELVARSDELPSLSERNVKGRALIRELFGGRRTRRGWPYLWIKPTYTYYEDDFFHEDSPSKYLVFSSWKFVPKAVALMVSSEIERRFTTWIERNAGSPLRFGDKGAYHIFDVCFPSVVLAAAVNPAGIAGRASVRRQDVVRAAERSLRALLPTAGIEIGPANNTALWRVVARLEAHGIGGESVRTALQTSATVEEDDGVSRHYEDHRREFAEWMEESQGRIVVSESRLHRLATIAAFSPAVSLLRALWSVYPDSRGAVPTALLGVCMNELRNYFNRPMVQAVIADHARKGRFAERVLDYCRDAHVQAMFDEYVYLLARVGQHGTAEKAAKQVGRVLGLGVGTPRINSTVGRGRERRIEPDAKPQRTHLALSFGDDILDEAGSGTETGASRKSSIRESFNSPFWPFVLATTSVGQEGLDFHCYCRDIVHWNLPSNPVDLEQREGRINRRDGLCLRQSIARDWPLARVLQGRSSCFDNVWIQVFDTLDRSPTPQRYKHGLFPHWVYECADAERTVRLRRHLPFYAHSRDATAYEQLKERLALYRLVFGQPRQQDLLEKIEERARNLQVVDIVQFRARLPAYMINLSPFGAGYARSQAHCEAESLIADAVGLERLVADVETMTTERSAELTEVDATIRYMLGLVRGHTAGRPCSRHALEKALAALVYLRNPYDDEFDGHGDVGLEDDIQMLQETARELEQEVPLPG